MNVSSSGAAEWVSLAVATLTGLAGVVREDYAMLVIAFAALGVPAFVQVVSRRAGSS